jgi:DNA-binding IclR family transcriptional regulator
VAASSQYTLQTLKRGLDLLDALDRGAGDPSLTELADRLGESQTVVFRLLRTLEDAGFVERDPRSKRYRVGLRVWEVGSRAMAHAGLLDVARPAILGLARATGETSHLSIVRGTDTVYVDVVDGGEPLRVNADPGMRVPIYLTASGKAILAHREEALVRAVVAAGMPRMTPATITTAAQLAARLEEIRRTGVSINREERRPDISAVAAPVFDRTGACVAAAGVSGPALRFRGDRLERTVEAVRGAAADISARLGHPVAAAPRVAARGARAGARRR